MARKCGGWKHRLCPLKLEPTGATLLLSHPVPTPGMVFLPLSFVFKSIPFNQLQFEVSGQGVDTLVKRE